VPGAVSDRRRHQRPSSGRPEDFERRAVQFDGNDEAALAAARAQWADLKNAGHDLTYWQQTDEGRWEKKD
jgi:DNA polymerase-3 subunit chi